jgi:hypothetical protein
VKKKKKKKKRRKKNGRGLLWNGGTGFWFASVHACKND